MKNYWKNAFSTKLSYALSIETIEWERQQILSQHSLASDQLRFLEEGLNSDTKSVNIRLRQGEYQFDLAKEIASSELQLHFPDVKDLIKKLYGEAKTEDIQFIRKIQTILKKMEKSNIVRILPKNKPWELQRYALTSFKFQDVDKNLIVLATDDQIKATRALLKPKPNQQRLPTVKLPTVKPSYAKIKIWALILVVILSYATVMWTIMQPMINLIALIPAFIIAVTCSFLLGKQLAQKQ